ncbi:MAG: hypothetical protein HY075_01905 [Deltaproteobacteria bacterium]|nr:hypothetical protein [Deltaproteobacteria bacterium]
MKTIPLAISVLGFAVLTAGCPGTNVPPADFSVSDLYLAGGADDGVLAYSYGVTTYAADGTSGSTLTARVRGIGVATDPSQYVSLDFADSGTVSGMVTTQGNLWLQTRDTKKKIVVTHVSGDPHVRDSEKTISTANGALSGTLSADRSTKVRVVVDGRGLTPDDQEAIEIFNDPSDQGSTIVPGGLKNQNYLTAYSPNDDLTALASTERITDCDDNDPKRHRPTACAPGSVVVVNDVSGATVVGGSFEGAPLAVWSDGKNTAVLSLRNDSTTALTTNAGVVAGPLVPGDACTAMAFDSDGTGYVLVVTQEAVTVTTLARGKAAVSDVVSARTASPSPLTQGQCAIRMKTTTGIGGLPATLARQVAWVEDGDEAPASAIVVSVTDAHTGEYRLKTKHDTVKNSINNVR